MEKTETEKTAVAETPTAERSMTKEMKMDIVELKTKTVAELQEIAEGLNVPGSSGMRNLLRSRAVICRNTPLAGPPLWNCPVECK